MEQYAAVQNLICLSAPDNSVLANIRCSTVILWLPTR